MRHSDIEELIARAAPSGADQQSGAFNFGKLLKGAAHAIFGREDELMTRYVKHLFSDAYDRSSDG